MANLSPPHPLEVFCWILDESRSPLSVDINDNQTVYHLKKAIVKESPVTFASVDAHQLTLWKVGGFSPFSLIYAHEILSGTRFYFRRTWNRR
jgi:hypothetical protein